MSFVSYDNEIKLKSMIKPKVVELLKEYGIDEENNNQTPTDDRLFVDRLIFNLYLSARGVYEGWDIPEGSKLAPDVTKTLGRDTIDQQIDAALVRTVDGTFSVDYKAKDALKAGDIVGATQPFGVSPYVVAPRLVLDKERKFVDGYHELRVIFQLLLQELLSVTEKKFHK